MDAHGDSNDTASSTLRNDKVIHCSDLMPTAHLKPPITSIWIHITRLHVTFQSIDAMSKNMVYLIFNRCRKLTHVKIRGGF